MDGIDISDPPPLNPRSAIAPGGEAFDLALMEIPYLIELGCVDALDGGCLLQEIPSGFPLGSVFLEGFQELREEFFPLTDEKDVEEIGKGLWI